MISHNTTHRQSLHLTQTSMFLQWSSIRKKCDDMVCTDAMYSTC